MRQKIGVVALGRPTFDVPFAEETARRAFEALTQLDVEIVGPQALLFDADGVRDALPSLQAEQIDLLLLLQVTFTDATMTVAIAEAIDAPMLLWGFPEARTGGRLRLNSLCGVNLAAHALGKAGREYAYLFAATDDRSVAERVEALSRNFRSTSPPAGQTPAPPNASATARAEDVQSHLRGTRIGRIGMPPDGFDTCVFDDQALAGLTGITVEQIELKQLFGTAAGTLKQNVAAIRARATNDLGDLNELEQEPEPAPLCRFERDRRKQRARRPIRPLLAGNVHGIWLRRLRSDGHVERRKDTLRLRGRCLRQRHDADPAIFVRPAGDHR